MSLFLTQYYLECLSHASYLVGDTDSGRAVVVDPQRDVSEYLRDAADHGLTITKVIETHFHADFLSGHLELAAATGADIVYGRAAAGRVGSQKALELRDEAPKCGARRKGDHLPCQNLALENGRCRLHGGLTPKGENWHRPRWPAPLLQSKDPCMEGEPGAFAAGVSGHCPAFAGSKLGCNFRKGRTNECGSRSLVC